MTPQLVQVLKREIGGDSDRQNLQIDVYDYAARATLDITGDGEFLSRAFARIRLIFTISRL